MHLPNAVQQNPNATVATLAGSLTIIVVWIVAAAGVEMPARGRFGLLGKKRPAATAAPTAPASANLT